MKKQTKDNLITYGIVIGAFVLVQLLANTGHLSSHMKGLLVPVTYYAVIAVALNLCVGILGELSIGHCGFMCVGAFSSAFFSKVTQDSIPTGPRFLLAFIIGILVAAAFGFLIGIPVLRLKGDYLAIVTLAFGEIIKNVLAAFYVGVDSKGVHFSMKSASDLGLLDDGKVIINGAMGITGSPQNSNFTIGIVVLLISLFVVQNLINSRQGRAIMAIRDNSIAAEASGINVTKYKMMAFTISAAIAGASGVLFSHNISSVTASSQYFGYNVSILVLVYVVLGGIGNIRGSVIAATILYMLPEMLRFLNKYRMLIYSIVLIVMMIVNWSPKIIEWRKRTFGKISIGRRKETA
ncbi:branched-chain amino acid ABC transporter permease [Butyrivibrio proteoclasticus]|uniref:branched-chain amino acid ABC transporter permease n=1 Tax=Butyrivibrio proteoclasticus TaxID=43305 RepID=UPI000479E644|nr:branched-chain amino acid ABC transporter permease [Butyrivibrio proteoclasticus]